MRTRREVLQDALFGAAALLVPTQFRLIDYYRPLSGTRLQGPGHDMTVKISPEMSFYLTDQIDAVDFSRLDHVRETMPIAWHDAAFLRISQHVHDYFKPSQVQARSPLGTLQTFPDHTAAIRVDAQTIRLFDGRDVVLRIDWHIDDWLDESEYVRGRAGTSEWYGRTGLLSIRFNRYGYRVR